MTKNINQLISVFSLVFLFSLILFTDPLNAQTIKGRISGVVVDNATGNPVESSDVRLLSAADSSFVAGTATNAAGNFLLEVIKLWKRP